MTVVPLSTTRTQTLVVIHHGELGAQSLAQQLGYFGFTVYTLVNLSELSSIVQSVSPAAIIMDLDFPEEELVGNRVTAVLSEAGLSLPPLIFISERSDLETRLHAVRAGGSAYLIKPVDVNDLVNILDILVSTLPPEPYRVLVVDDSLLVARRHAAILRAEGMQVNMVIHPQDMLHALEEQKPDLVLLDMYMPGCEGRELAAVIRQQPAFHGMPIVYLSSETDREIQLAAMGKGGDDFLTKPVSAAHLIAVVSSRIERARTIRAQLNHDSLTGLLTHGALKEQFARELARARRNGSELSVVMIDVDHFKKVNDTYGHATGDRVLKSLARLLRQHLRASDVVGRYGGEEFVVLLPETKSEVALRVLDRIRELFAQIQHHSDSTTFMVSFSAGIASVPTFFDADEVVEAADAALYRAKQGGRNQVRLATPPEVKQN